MCTFTPLVIIHLYLNKTFHCSLVLIGGGGGGGGGGDLTSGLSN